MKKTIYNKLTFLRDRLPHWMCPPIDWLRDIFYPYEDYDH